MPSKRKKKAQEKRKKTGGKRKVKSGDLCILKPGKLKFCFSLEMIRRPRSAQPKNGILCSFGSVWPDSDWISF